LLFVFIPLYLKNKIYYHAAIPGRAIQRNGEHSHGAVLAVVYVFVNLTSIIYLGALAVSAISGISFEACIAGLALFAIVVTLGGMKVIGYTDVFQVFVLIWVLGNHLPGADFGYPIILDMEMMSGKDWL